MTIYILDIQAVDNSLHSAMEGTSSKATEASYE